MSIILRVELTHARCPAPKAIPGNSGRARLGHPKRAGLSAAMHGAAQGEANSPDGRSLSCSGSYRCQNPRRVVPPPAFQDAGGRDPVDAERYSGVQLAVRPRGVIVAKHAGGARAKVRARRHA
jgi:hypothetical protein